MSPAATINAVEGERAALEAADELFYTRGVGAVTMAEIRDRSGVSLRRLYSMYPAKSDLVAAWLRHRHTSWTAGFRARIEERIDSGDTPIDSIFDALEAWMTETGFRGCGFINTHAESSDLTDEHLEIVRSHKEALAAYVETLTPEGRAIAVVIDGAIVQAAIFGSTEPIQHAHRAANALASIRSHT